MSTAVDEKPAVLSAFSEWRNSLKLPNPGSFEMLHSEIRGVLVSGFLFDGAKFDFTKVLSPNFQVTHSFALGSQARPSSYSFGASYGQEKNYVFGNIDHDGNLQGRGQYELANKLLGKFQAQVGSQAPSTVQLELDYAGKEFSTNLKLLNPDPVEESGTLVASHLQSITKNIAVGAEYLYQQQGPKGEVHVTYVSKYTGEDFVLTGTWSKVGMLQASYFQRVNEKVGLAAELNVMASGGRRDAVCAIGGKWDLRQSCFRGQVDTTGKVSAVLEERMAPGFSVLFTGEIDHMKGQSRFGMGLQLEN